MALASGSSISARDGHTLSLGEESGGCETTESSDVLLSLALILVVKFLGGGGTSSGLW